MALEVEIEVRRTGPSGILAPMSGEQIQRMLDTEFGGMNEVMADLYADTGDPRWLDLSYRFEHTPFVDPLKRGEDPLAGLHGNTQVPKLIGSRSATRTRGDRPTTLPRRPSSGTRVVKHHSFATGGHGKDEYFGEPDRLGEHRGRPHRRDVQRLQHAEADAELFASQPDVRYADFHERALFNHVLGSYRSGRRPHLLHGPGRPRRAPRIPATCAAASRAAWAPGWRTTRCTGDGLYYESGDRLWVNLYVPSVAQWESAGASADDGDRSLPEGDAATLTVKIKTPRDAHAGAAPAVLGRCRLRDSAQRPAGEGFGWPGILRRDCARMAHRRHPHARAAEGPARRAATRRRQARCDPVGAARARRRSGSAAAAIRGRRR